MARQTFEAPKSYGQAVSKNPFKRGGPPCAGDPHGDNRGEKCQRVRTATGKIACSYCYRPFKKL